MKIKRAIYEFRGYTFTFTPFRKRKLRGRLITRWKIIVDYRGKKYRIDYLAFVPSAHICRFIKKTKTFLKNPQL